MPETSSNSQKPCCVTCKKTDAELQKCAKCLTATYCSRDCQKADWKAHKRICTQNASTGADGPGTPSANPTTSGSEQSRAQDRVAPIDKPFTHLHNRTWLHNRSEKDVYKLLIDVYRLRMEDNYTFDGDADVDSIYGGAANGLRGFRRFLAKAKSRPNLLPPWWNDAKQRECEALGMGGTEWSDLGAAVEKSDINEHYGDPTFAMQLRLVGEVVYGRGPGGQPGASITEQMMVVESAGRAFSMMTLDRTTGRVG